MEIYSFRCNNRVENKLEDLLHDKVVSSVDSQTFEGASLADITKSVSQTSDQILLIYSNPLDLISYNLDKQSPAELASSALNYINNLLHLNDILKDKLVLVSFELLKQNRHFLKTEVETVGTFTDIVQKLGYSQYPTDSFNDLIAHYLVLRNKELELVLARLAHISKGTVLPPKTIDDDNNKIKSIILNSGNDKDLKRLLELEKTKNIACSESVTSKEEKIQTLTSKSKSHWKRSKELERKLALKNKELSYSKYIIENEMNKTVFSKIRALFKSKNSRLADVKTIIYSDFYNENWYLQQYPDVKESQLHPAEHFLVYGREELRNPSKNFDTKSYLEINSDLKSSSINPLLHYEKYGKSEKRKIRR